MYDKGSTEETKGKPRRCAFQFKLDSALRMNKELFLKVGGEIRRKLGKVAWILYPKFPSEDIHDKSETTVRGVGWGWGANRNTHTEAKRKQQGLPEHYQRRVFILVAKAIGHLAQ